MTAYASIGIVSCVLWPTFFLVGKLVSQNGFGPQNSHAITTYEDVRGWLIGFGQAAVIGAASGILFWLILQPDRFSRAPKLPTSSN